MQSAHEAARRNMPLDHGRKYNELVCIRSMIAPKVSPRHSRTVSPRSESHAHAPSRLARYQDIPFLVRWSAVVAVPAEERAKTAQIQIAAWIKNMQVHFVTTDMVSDTEM